jgi:26S proteasome regulatory subunit N1
MGTDTLMLNKKDGEWIYKVKNEGLTAAAASIGNIFLWDPSGGSNHINDYLELTDGYAKAGANIAIGLYNIGIRDECDPAKALLEE